jgi:3-hydroxyacyl-CoA dehydrogenase
MRLVNTSTSLDTARGSGLVFEAVSENPELKVKLIREIENGNDTDTWYLTNTSSIPISNLDKESGLEGRIIGFHFYNPPAVQKLVELITAKTTRSDLHEFSVKFAGALRKTLVPANDIAGFIGNGHFMRDILYAASEVEKLHEKYTLTQAIWMINRVSQDFLIRPMGIFQLTDYVGLEVCQYIMKVMDPYMPDENLHCELIDKMLDQGVRGGQNPDGSQKNGILSYEKGRITGIWDMDRKEYLPVDAVEVDIAEDLGELPEGHHPWKNLVRDPAKPEILDQYFSRLTGEKTLGASLAAAYGKNSRKIGELLVEKGVAVSTDDVNTVLLTGFFHAYGPVNDYFSP